MHTITFVAVISNSFIIGFTSAAAFELLVDEGEESSSIEDRCALHAILKTRHRTMCLATLTFRARAVHTDAGTYATTCGLPSLLLST
jgi:hypothetical protein|eukprot:COSAG03_NODE_127_length_12134_cov_101.810469_8_plen_87_part_00